MRQGTFLLALVITIPAVADAPATPIRLDAAPTLLEKALDLPLAASDSRPTGQCIFACGDRQIILRRCPDGECPDYNCETGTASCRSR